MTPKRIIGLVLLAIGAGIAVFALVTGGDDEDRTLLIYGVAVTFGLLGLWFQLPHASMWRGKPWWTREAQLVPATVVGVSDRTYESGGGVDANGVADTPTINPKLHMDLRVDPPGGTPYSTSHDQHVDFTHLMTIRPGIAVQVRVHPKKPEKVWVELGEGLEVAPGGDPDAAPMPLGTSPTGISGNVSVESFESAADLLARGQRGTATIVSIKDTGMTAEQARVPITTKWGSPADHLVVFTVEVRLDKGGDPYQAKFMGPVPVDRVATVVPGSSLRVAVDESNPTKTITIDWFQS